MTGPIRVLFLCSEYPPDPHGGLGVFVRDLARALVPRGHRVHVLGFSKRPREAEEAGVHLHLHPAPGAGVSVYTDLLRRQWTLSRHARRLVEREQIDIVEAAEYKGDGAFLHSPTRMRAKLVVRYHGSTSVYARLKGGRVSRLVRWLEGRGLAQGDARVAVSAFIERETFATFPAVGHAAAVIPNFTNTLAMAPREGVPRDPNLLLYAGRISIAKGLPRLFRALPLLFDRCPAARLELVGADTNEGPGGGSLTASLLDSLGPPHRERVKFLGAVPHDELAHHYCRATASVLPSVAEAFSLVALEAMACECPPVVSAGTSLAEVVPDGVAGLHADVDNPEDVAAKLVRILTEPGFAHRLGHAGRELVLRQHTAERAAEANEQFYLRCLGT